MKLYHVVGAHGLGKAVCSHGCTASQARAWFASGHLNRVSELSFHFIFYKNEKSCNVDLWWWNCWRMPVPSALTHSEESRIHILWEPFLPGYYFCCWSPPVEMQLINDQWADDDEEPERHQTTAGVLWRLREQWRKKITHVFLTVTLKLFNVLNPFK